MKRLSLVFLILFCVTYTNAQMKYYHLEGLLEGKEIAIELYQTNEWPPLSHLKNQSPNDLTYFGYIYHPADLKTDLMVSSNSSSTNTSLHLSNFNKSQKLVWTLTGDFDGKTFKGWNSKNFQSNPVPDTFHFKVKNGPVEFQQFYDSTDFILNLTKNQSIEGALVYDCIIPAEPSIQKSFIEMLSFGAATSCKEWASSQWILSGFENFVKINVLPNSANESKIKENKPRLSYRIYPVAMNDEFLILCKTESAFTQSAYLQPYDDFHFYVYSFKQNKWLGIEDVLNLDFVQEVIELINQQIHKDHHLPLSQALNEGAGSKRFGFIVPKVPFSENFILDKYGITFYYKENQIIQSEKGIFSIRIPYKKLGIYIHKDFKRPQNSH